MLEHHVIGHGPPLLLVHGAAEDAGMLDGQARAFAAHGRRVITYNRRGTGDGCRDGWPDGGVAAHADDAAGLLRSLDAVPATVLGFSSGGVVALAIAARHPDVVTRVVAWEPAAVGVLPGAEETHAGLMAPIEAHLAAHPGDWTGAYTVMLDVISEGRADHDSPLVAAQRVNAEAAVRDDARIITRHAFTDGELPADKVVVAVGATAVGVHAAIAERLADLVGRPAVVVDAADDHEVYLERPAVLADAFGGW